MRPRPYNSITMAWSLIYLLAAGLLARLSAAQASGWVADQVNTTMCQWQSPRAAIIRDTLYIDGGYLWWEPGMADGTFGAPINDGNPLGLVYLLNFSTPFNITPSFNLTNVFTTISKAAGGSEANNIGPLYYDGAMFANDYEWFTYGGLLSLTDAYPTPAENSVAEYEAFVSGPPRQFSSGYILKQLPDGITRYVTDGAGVSVPSENLGFYFSGLRSDSFGPIYYDPGAANASLNADTVSTTLIELDMTVQLKEVWKNYTLPTTVPGRANAEIVWIPVSTQGILVAIGGVIFPSYANVNQTDNAAQTAESEQQSPSFMSTVAIYDIANQVWYEQETQGAPGQLTQGCTVVASAQDGSSHNIYWYGGFDGLHPAGELSDDVWVLSVPSFMWMKVYSGTSTHGRAGHKCTKPYPDQMFVIGGYSSLSGTELTCVEGGIIQIYNLSSNSWIESYNPNVWSNYTVPSMIYDIIGGAGTGSATQTAPSPTITQNATMIGLFQDQYNTSKITTFYPYHATATAANNRTILPSVVAKSSGTPSFLAPVLGVILGLVFVTCLVVAIMLYRRRKILQVGGTATQSEVGTIENRRWVTSWLRGTPVDAKAPTVTTDETPSSPYDEDRPYMPPEIGGGQVHEMMDTSRPSELQDSGTGFIHLSQLSNGQYGQQGQGLTSSPSVTSHTSSISNISANNRPSISAVVAPRDDSPSNPNNSRVVSGLSGVSSVDRGHLRGISETSQVSGASDGTTEFVTPMETVVRPSAVSPVSPRREEVGGSLAAGSPGQNRKSNFSEELDEQDKK